jgi:hypothetical protein
VKITTIPIASFYKIKKKKTQKTSPATTNKQTNKQTARI